MSDRPFIVLLSHMRSYSSVLSHILGSHPEICGYSELQCETLTRRGFQAAQKILQQRDDYANARFLFDKLLHNGPVEFDLIEKQQIIPLVCVRQPEATLKSIINMGQLYCQNENRKRRLTDIGQVMEYYISRVRWLEYFVSRYRDRCLVFRSEQLLNDRPSLFKRLREFLALEGELRSTYQIFENTGVPGHGDPSPIIRLGKIVDRVNSYDSIDIPTQLLNIAKQTHLTFLASADRQL